VGCWDEAPVPRDQILLIPMTLGDRIPDDHPVRLFYEILASLDWSAWERHYCGVAGQPAIPPMIVAGAILYGMSHGIRSSRRLEWACGNAVDFIWLVEGRGIDHSTFCNFRTRFDRELKDLFRQLGRLAMSMGLIRLNQVALDGTRVRAEGGRLDDLAAEKHVGKAEAPADDSAVTEASTNLVRRRRGRDVEVLGCAAEQEIAHASAHQIGLVLAPTQALHDTERVGIDLIQADFHRVMP